MRCSAARSMHVSVPHGRKSGDGLVHVFESFRMEVLYLPVGTSRSPSLLYVVGCEYGLVGLYERRCSFAGVMGG